MRIENIKYSKIYKVWFLRFLRIRSNDNPSLCTEDSQSDFLELGDKYVSEDVTCLYDPSNSVIMIQKNLHSVSPVGVETYIGATWSGNEILSFRRVLDPSAFSKARNAESCRNINVRFADVSNIKKTGVFKHSISAILSSTSTLNTTNLYNSQRALPLSQTNPTTLPSYIII